MKPIFAMAASAALALAPLAGVAQTEDEVTERLNQEQLQNTPEPTIQGGEAGVVATPAQTAALPVLSTIPAGAIVVGGLVVVAGVAIGIAASDDETTSTTATN